MKEDFQKRICANPMYSSADKIVALALCWFINRRTRTAWPSYETLAKVTGLTDRAVKKSIKKMEAMRDLRVVRRRREDGKNDSNIYVLRLERTVDKTVDSPRPQLHVVGGMVNGIH